MTEEHLHPLAVAYLRRLNKLSRGLPRGRRRELVSEITAHLAEAIPVDASMAEAGNILERFGSQEEIIAAEQRQAGLVARPGNWREVLTVILLLFGGFVFGIGWLAGLVLLWTSEVWSLRDKLIGTLVIPGGLATSALLLLGIGASSSSSTSGGCRAVRVVVSGARAGRGAATVTTPTSPVLPRCHLGLSSGPDILGVLLIAVIVLAPIASAAYLAVRAGRTRRSSPPAADGAFA